ncbi:LysR family transcriptional regulator [Paenibacillus sp. JTLBN-2024]
MDLTYLNTFREVALRQSFTRAAEELGYAQSSVTTQIQKLEKAYGVQLFERFGKGLRLTSAGEELLRFTVQMLDLHQQSKERLGRQSGGTLSIGTIDSLAAYFLPLSCRKSGSATKGCPSGCRPVARRIFSSKSKKANWISA